MKAKALRETLKDLPDDCDVYHWTWTKTGSEIRELRPTLNPQYKEGRNVFYLTTQEIIQRDETSASPAVTEGENHGNPI